MTNQPDSLRLNLVEAFLAAAAYGNYTEAGTVLGVDATTVRRRMEQLEIWLHRVLITTDVPFEITEDGDDFVLVAAKVVELVDEAGLKAEIGKTRVQADGTVTIEGQKIDTDATREIGQSLVASRATINPNYTPPAPISGKDVDVSFLASAPPA